jgi:anaerobic magnesium-protoporphyrin IX monomethyl ester cyclase
MKENDIEIALINPFNEKIVLRDFYSSTISKGNYNWPNIDLLCMAAILSKKFKVQIIDANTLKMNATDVLSKINSKNLKGIIFSVGKSVIDDDYNFIKSIKSEVHSIVKIVVTGGIIYHNSLDEIRTNKFIDACILNFTTPDILNYFLNYEADLKNIVFRKDDKIITKPIEMNETDFKIPIPPHNQLPLHKYQLSHGYTKPVASVLTSYGCPHRCSFCVSAQINFQYRNVDNIIQELDYLHSLGVKQIIFRDNIFGFHKKSCKELLKKIIDRKYDLKWVSDSRVDILDEEMISLMSKSGCHALHFGIESANEDTLKKYEKNLKDISLVEETIELCKKYRILSVGYFILGLPGETKNQVEKTIDYSIRLGVDYASYNLPIPIFGTNLREESLKNKWIINVEEKYDGSSQPLISTNELTPLDLISLRKKAYKKFYFRINYIIKTLLNIRTLFQIKMAVKESLGLLMNKS